MSAFIAWRCCQTASGAELGAGVRPGAAGVRPCSCLLACVWDEEGLR